MAYGTVNADVIGTSVAGSNLGAGDASLLKNRLINGAMIINQRATSITATGYSVDRWKYTGSQSSKGTVAQNTTAPAGFTNSLGFTSSSAYSVTSTDFFFLSQVIEGFNIADLGWGTASAKTVTLSFQVYSSLTGTFGGVLTNGANNRTYPFTYSVASANTWTTISVTVAGDTTGTWATDNTAGLFVLFGLGCGSTYSGTAGSWSGGTYFSATGATSVVGTNGATFYITGVQLEVGSSATGFEYRQYQQELALCQRYYQYIGGSSSNTELLCGANGTARVRGSGILSTTMRASPTMALSGTPTFYIYGSGSPTYSSNVVTVATTYGLTSYLFDLNTSGGMTAGQVVGIDLGASSFTFNAEL